MDQQLLLYLSLISLLGIVAILLALVLPPFLKRSLNKMEPTRAEYDPLDIDLLHARLYIALANKLVTSELRPDGSVDFKITDEGFSEGTKRSKELKLDISTLDRRKALALVVYGDPEQDYFPPRSKF